MTSTIESTLRHVLFYARTLNNCELEYVIIAVLLELGIPTKNMGFSYLKSALGLYRGDAAQLITKEIYPDVAKNYDPKPTTFQVESSIRRAIKIAWINRNDTSWAYYFQPDEDGQIRRPTNAEFISRVAYFLELWQGCCKGVSRVERG